MKNEIALKPSYWASVSGGKDSLYMLHLILNNLDKYPLDGVVHYELEIDYPFIKNVVDYMQERCELIGIKFLRLRPETKWQDFYNKYGFPTRQARWCNNVYKLNCNKQLSNWLKENGKIDIHYIGFCADEEKRFKFPLFDREGVRQIYSLAELGIKESTILQWAKDEPLFNDYYKTNKRCGCYMCPMSTYTEDAYLALYYPDLYDQKMMLAKESEEKTSDHLNRPFSIWSSNSKYNTDYRKKVIAEKYVPQLKEELNKISIFNQE